MERLENRCVPQSSCNFTGSASVGIVRLAKTVTCCSTDFCIPELPLEPILMEVNDSNYNGLVCPMCGTFFGVTFLPCKTDKIDLVIKCRDEETRCALLVVTGFPNSHPDKKWQGCATPSMCNLGTQMDFHLPGPLTIRSSCSNASEKVLDVGIIFIMSLLPLYCLHVLFIP
ncbi:phospholipase A2 inhibitor gamma subunit B-like [Hyperolius riggenbachi]|uniref:phospholipase A2 inhibitor gamma subunit B-like n=1 Tax=Hyperolius riggenbachi TaxID=752182 RepID=UPI0035A3CAE4